MKFDEFRFKPRSYLHFDPPLSRQTAWALASNPIAVARHAFYPFIGFTMATRRLKRVDGVRTPVLKEREIKIAAHADAAIYSYYGQLLAELYERAVATRHVPDVATAFRSRSSGGTNVDFAGEVFSFIKANRPCEAMAYDVEGFFDNLDHELLRVEWATLVGAARLPADHFKVFSSLTKFSWVDREAALQALGISRNNPKAGRRFRLCRPAKFRQLIRNAGLIFPNPRGGRGIPQGSPMSAVMSNVYMIPFDRAVSDFVSERGGLYRRYCDDIIVVVSEEYALEVDQFLSVHLERRHLTFNVGKTDRVIFEAEGVPVRKPLQYLGFTFDGVEAMLRIGSLSRYYSKMRRGVSLAKQTQRKFNRLEQQKRKPLTALRRRKLYLQYSYLYDRRRRPKGRDPKTSGNFLTYAYKAARKLGSKAIMRQVRGHWFKLQSELHKPITDQLRGP